MSIALDFETVFIFMKLERASLYRSSSSSLGLSQSVGVDIFFAAQPMNY